jgi:hypothetical protein
LTALIHCGSYGSVCGIFESHSFLFLAALVTKCG